MTAHEWLSEYLEIQEDIWSHEEALECEYARVTSKTSKQTAAKGGTGADQRKFDRYAAAVESHQQQITALLDEQAKIQDAINSLPNPRHRTVLRYLYICGYSVNTTADRMNVDRHTVTAYRDRALSQVLVPRKD